MNTIKTIFAAYLCHLLISGFSLAFAQGGIGSLDTNGTIFLVNQKTAVQTDKGAELLESFSLGGTTRRGTKFYYVAEPDGVEGNALFTANLSNSTISHVALDRSESVRALFFNGKKLYGVFYDGNLGTAGVYRISPTTGVTTLVLNLSDLDLEPIPGAITKIGDFFYILAKPEIDSTARRLIRFKTKAGSAVIFNVVDKLGAPVLCEKLKVNVLKNNFICLASASEETELKVCKLALKGQATCLKTLPGILRVGSGHTLLTDDQKIYYAFVYAPGEPDNQRLIKFNSKGALKANTAISGIMIGAHFKSEEPLVVH